MMGAWLFILLALVVVGMMVGIFPLLLALLGVMVVGMMPKGIIMIMMVSMVIVMMLPVSSAKKTIVYRSTSTSTMMGYVSQYMVLPMTQEVILIESRGSRTVAQDTIVEGLKPYFVLLIAFILFFITILSAHQTIYNTHDNSNIRTQYINVKAG